MALDWLGGCRSTLEDGDLTGLLVGHTTKTTAAQIYRAMLEASAFGTRRVVEALEAGGVRVRGITACGGLVANELLMQLLADATGRNVNIVGSGLASAIGAAIRSTHQHTQNAQYAHPHNTLVSNRSVGQPSDVNLN